MKRITLTSFPTQVLAAPADLGGAIRSARTHAGLTLRDAALTLGVATQTLNDIEMGKPGVGLGNVLKVASGLGVDLFAAPKRNREAVQQMLASSLS
jgi:transcriptional regulator with XRE-family HTH domain